jgi:hypothetical protein
MEDLDLLKGVVSGSEQIMAKGVIELLSRGEGGRGG